MSAFPTRFLFSQTLDILKRPYFLWLYLCCLGIEPLYYRHIHSLSKGSFLRRGYSFFRRRVYINLFGSISLIFLIILLRITGKRAEVTYFQVSSGHVIDSLFDVSLLKRKPSANTIYLAFPTHDHKPILTVWNIYYLLTIFSMSPRSISWLWEPMITIVQDHKEFFDKIGITFSFPMQVTSGSWDNECNCLNDPQLKERFIKHFSTIHKSVGLFHSLNYIAIHLRDNHYYEKMMNQADQTLPRYDYTWRNTPPHLIESAVGYILEHTKLDIVLVGEDSFYPCDFLNSSRIHDGRNIGPSAYIEAILNSKGIISDDTSVCLWPLGQPVALLSARFPLHGFWANCLSLPMTVVDIDQNILTNQYLIDNVSDVYSRLSLPLNHSKKLYRLEYTKEVYLAFIKEFLSHDFSVGLDQQDCSPRQLHINNLILHYLHKKGYCPTASKGGRIARVWCDQICNDLP